MRDTQAYRSAERHTRAYQCDERDRVGYKPGQYRCREMREYLSVAWREPQSEHGRYG